jgi:hypothetical protein
MHHARCVASARDVRRCLPTARPLTSRASAGKEFIRVIEQTQPEFRDKVSCCSCAGWQRHAAAQRACCLPRRDAGGHAPSRGLLVRSSRGASASGAGVVPWASRRLTPPAVRAQFLCYKQLKKFLKQLPDTSVGARSLLAPRDAAAGRIRLGQYASGLGRRVLAYSTASAPRARLPTPDARPAAALTADGAADGAPGSAGAQPEHIRELTQQERAFVRALNTVRARSGERAARALRHAADCAAPCGARA